jgi:hypothetical protein
VTTVKSWMNLTGNEMVFVVKKPGAGPKPAKAILDQVIGIDSSITW